MAVYELTNRLSHDPESNDTWVIERAVPGGRPMRLLFQGTQREALSEVKRLNTFLKQKTAAPDRREPEPRGVRTPMDGVGGRIWGVSEHAD